RHAQQGIGGRLDFRLGMVRYGHFPGAAIADRLHRYLLLRIYAAGFGTAIPTMLYLSSEYLGRPEGLGAQTGMGGRIMRLRRWLRRDRAVVRSLRLRFAQRRDDMF